MLGYILFDDDSRNDLLPFTHTRPVADIRCGILTMRERWEKMLETPTGTLTEAYLQSVFPLQAKTENIYINAALFADEALAEEITSLPEGHALTQGDLLIAFRTQTLPHQHKEFLTAVTASALFTTKAYTGSCRRLQKVTDIFTLNDAALRADFLLLTRNRQSAPVPAHVTVSGDSLFIEEGAIIRPGSVINTTTGPVYLSAEAEIMEGCLLRGPVALGAHAVLKMGAKVYGATTIGTNCKVGGEINNVVFFANSNKGHDGFLGNAVIGEWCNLGADTNCSNLKNNYDEVKIWHEYSHKSVPTGLQFCGLLMGDHSKCAINTMFNTGTIVGVSSNIFGNGFPEKFIPSFCWGGSEKISTYNFQKAMDTADRMMARRGKSLSPEERDMYHYLFEHTAQQRYIFAHE